MRAERESTLGNFAKGTLKLPTSSAHTSARLRAEALAFNLAAVNAGRFPPSPKVLEALERLAWAAVWDVRLEMAA